MQTPNPAENPKVRDILGRLGETPLGSPDVWPSSLRTLFGTIAGSPSQIVLFWGPEYLAVYNDAYAPTIGNKHPDAFGRSAAIYWSELWDDLKPLLDQVREKREPVFMKDRPFYIERHGRPETVTFDISYSPVPGEDGSIDGVLCLVNETTERTAAEQQLRESEARFRNMADHAPVMLWVVDDQGYCNYLNTRWYEFTGQTREEAEGFGWLEATHPDDRKKATEIFLEALSRKVGFRLEYRLRRADGTYCWAIDAAEPRFTPDGRFLGYIGTVIDIDERHEFERRLAESESGLRALTNSIDQLIWSTRPDGFHDYYNDRWYEYTGVPQGSTDGDGWNEIFHPEDRERAFKTWRECLSTGRPYHIEYRLRHRSGQYRWVIGRANPARGEDGAIVRWHGTCTDVHELKTAEIQRSAIVNFDDEITALRDPADIALAAARVVGETIEASRVGYGAIDNDLGTVIIERDWSAPGHSSLVGLRRLRDYGEFLDDLNRGDVVIVRDARTDPRTADQASELASLSARSSIVVPLREKGELAAVFFVNNARPTEWQNEDIGFVRDIAFRVRNAVERRRAESHLVKLTESLEEEVAARTEELRRSEEHLRQSQKLETIGKLTGGVAHDFNNLLQVVAGNLQLLQKDVDGDERAERRVANAMAGVNRGAKLASQLLAFGRRQALDPKVINVGRFIRDMDDMLRRSIGEAIEIETIVGGGLWNCLADPTQVENAVLNLAINARDAMDGQGRLTIEVGNAYLDDDYARRHSEVEAGQYVVLSVTDTGSGIPADILDRVVEPFFSTKPEGKGSGLGLSMVFGFAKQSGGHVKIYSEIGEGTTVKMYLPRATASEDREITILSGPIVGGTETILVAEDDDEVRETVTETLTDLGYKVLKAPNADAALTVIEAGVAIDLLFTDVVMPGGMKSTELARKARERQPDIAVLYTSGYTENSIVHGGRLDAGVELISKPYTREALAWKIRHVLGNRPQRMFGSHARSQGASDSAEPETRQVGARGKSLRVLLVEDDALIRMNTAELLEDIGHLVVEAGSGEEAIIAFKADPPDVVIVDVGLPDMSGVALAEQFAALGEDAKIVFATGHDSRSSIFPDGAIVITKPYGPAELENALKRVENGALS